MIRAKSVSAPVRPSISLPADGRPRAVVDAVLPVVDGGRFAVKRIAGRPFEVDVHAFTDGHDVIRVLFFWRSENVAQADSVEMKAVGNDVWRAEVALPEPGAYRYWAVAWVDHFRSWRTELQRRVDAADIRVAALVGAVEEGRRQVVAVGGARPRPEIQ